MVVVKDADASTYSKKPPLARQKTVGKNRQFRQPGAKDVSFLTAPSDDDSLERGALEFRQMFQAESPSRQSSLGTNQFMMQPQNSQYPMSQTSFGPQSYITPMRGSHFQQSQHPDFLVETTDFEMQDEYDEDILPFKRQTGRNRSAIPRNYENRTDDVCSFKHQQLAYDEAEYKHKDPHFDYSQYHVLQFPDISGGDLNRGDYEDLFAEDHYLPRSIFELTPGPGDFKEKQFTSPQSPSTIAFSSSASRYTAEDDFDVQLDFLDSPLESFNDHKKPLDAKSSLKMKHDPSSRPQENANALCSSLDFDHLDFLDSPLEYSNVHKKSFDTKSLQKTKHNPSSRPQENANALRSSLDFDHLDFLDSLLESSSDHKKPLDAKSLQKTKHNPSSRPQEKTDVPRSSLDFGHLDLEQLLMNPYYSDTPVSPGLGPAARNQGPAKSVDVSSELNPKFFNSYGITSLDEAHRESRTASQAEKVFQLYSSHGPDCGGGYDPSYFDFGQDDGVPPQHPLRLHAPHKSLDSPVISSTGSPGGRSRNNRLVSRGSSANSPGDSFYTDSSQSSLSRYSSCGSDSSQSSYSYSTASDNEPWSHAGISVPLSAITVNLKDKEGDGFQIRSQLFPHLLPMEQDPSARVFVHESEAEHSFFPESLTPLQDYGPMLDSTLQAQTMVQEGKALFQEHMATTGYEAMEKLKLAHRVRHNRKRQTLKPVLENALEAGWLDRLLNDECISFDEIPQETVKEWNIERGIKFVQALTAYIPDELFFDEALLDFCRDFFIPHIIKPLLGDPWSQHPFDYRVHIGTSLVPLFQAIIQAMPSVPTFEVLIKTLKGFLTNQTAEAIYDALVQRMKVHDVLSTESDESPVKQQTPPKIPRYIHESDISALPTEAERDLAQKALKKYKKALKTYSEAREAAKKARKRATQSGIIYQRSFEYLKLLLSHFPQPAIRPSSPFSVALWLNVNLSIPERVQAENLHSCQEFFDAIFFSPVFYAILHPERSDSEFSISNLERFFSSHANNQADAAIGLRLLMALNRFISLSRFNVVSNTQTEMLRLRRLLLRYILFTGFPLMGGVVEKIENRAVSFNLPALFEALYIYDVLPQARTLPESAAFIGTLIADKNTASFEMAIIYFTYHPVPYNDILKTLLTVKNRSFDTRNTYLEIFALVNTVELLPLQDRKVIHLNDHALVQKQSLHEKAYELSMTDDNFEDDEVVGSGRLSDLSDHDHGTASPRDRVFHHEIFNLPGRHHFSLSDMFVYNWSMPNQFKNFNLFGALFEYPYFTYSARIVLARVFGIPFSSSGFNAQARENLSWNETIDFANFLIEREAFNLVQEAIKTIDPELYFVARIVDPQAESHLKVQLISDEPTHYVNQLITSYFYSLSAEEQASFYKSIDRTALFTMLFNRWKCLPSVASLLENPIQLAYPTILSFLPYCRLAEI